MLAHRLDIYPRDPRTSIFGRNWTEFHRSVYFNDLSDVRRLIENGIDINLQAAYGETPLHIACCTGHTKCIVTLLEQSPSMNAKDRCFGRTPLAIFVKFKRHKTRILKKMLDMGADPNLCCVAGVTPLHIVANDILQTNKKRSMKYTYLLLKYKANVNSQNKWGDTPLHLAIRSKFIEIVTILLDNGAGIKIENYNGLSSLQAATHPGNQKSLKEIVKYIILQTYCKKHVDLDVLNEICECEGMEVFKDKCDKELSELQSRITDTSFVTYFDFLVSSPDIVAKYLRNKNISKSVKAFNKEEYIYGSRLDQVFRNAFKRNDAFETGYRFCRKVFPVILPDLCLDVIFEHLSNADLMQLKNVTSL